jgi:hypothetical protein
MADFAGALIGIVLSAILIGPFALAIYIAIKMK